jgi:hypothetical protein
MQGEWFAPLVVPGLYAFAQKLAQRLEEAYGDDGQIPSFKDAWPDAGWRIARRDRPRNWRMAA